ncbi:MAG: M3 family oligoendopeptidase [Dissulfurimicrobium sp.]|uniref:M3 family oligoendopeptidase n=1 Tax=Dissulfurimicrobium TaxID=1769732 RepID=UPI001EDBD62E|nr:M3 family oligoendopeptidase [Dissulfurimicrobium hydrothermale]UKL13320.1 M3 family oligoendopeptidase [Dissulfurimicrobium hydrothermale]
MDSPKGLNVSDVIWDLDCLYTGLGDPRIKKDMDKAGALAVDLARRYAGKVAELSAEGLYGAIKEMEGLAVAVARLEAFAQLVFATRVNDPEAGAFLQRITEFSSSISREVVFFDIEWANTPDEKADLLLSYKTLQHYRHYLKSARRYRPHLLSETEERLLVDISPAGRSAWTKLFDKVLAFKRFGKNGRTQEEVLADLYSPERGKRKDAAAEFTEGLRDECHVIVHIFNTILADKMIEDRLRRYPDWISSMNLANEIDAETVGALVEAVIGRYDLVSRYYKIKRSLLGLEVLYDYDRYAPVAALPRSEISWSGCKDIVLEAFGRFSSDILRLARRFFDEGWIHAPIVSGKIGGAFAHPTVPDAHPYVLVNYSGNLRDVETVAHELGHGVHQVLAGQVGFFNSRTPLVLAETASVFGEMLVFKDMMKKISARDERLGLVCSKIESIFATVFRQIAMNRFEDAIHNHRRKAGELSLEDFCTLWLKTQREMFQDGLVLTDDYGLWWSYIGHFLHAPGYVYAYAFGELLVLSLYALYEDGFPGFVDRYLELLASGGSKSPYELLEPFGVDIRDPAFWRKGLGVIDEMIDEVEALA